MTNEKWPLHHLYAMIIILAGILQIFDTIVDGRTITSKQSRVPASMLTYGSTTTNTNTKVLERIPSTMSTASSTTPLKTITNSESISTSNFNGSNKSYSENNGLLDTTSSIVKKITSNETTGTIISTSNSNNDSTEKSTFKNVIAFVRNDVEKRTGNEKSSTNSMVAIENKQNLVSVTADEMLTETIHEMITKTADIVMTDEMIIDTADVTMTKTMTGEMTVETADKMTIETADEMTVETADEMTIETAEEMTVETAEEKMTKTADEMMTKGADEMVTETAGKMMQNTYDEMMTGTVDDKIEGTSTWNTYPQVNDFNRTIEDTDYSTKSHKNTIEASNGKNHIQMDSTTNKITKSVTQEKSSMKEDRTSGISSKTMDLNVVDTTRAESSNNESDVYCQSSSTEGSETMISSATTTSLSTNNVLGLSKYNTLVVVMVGLITISALMTCVIHTCKRGAERGKYRNRKMKLKLIHDSDSDSDD